MAFGTLPNRPHFVNLNEKIEMIFTLEKSQSNEPIIKPMNNSSIDAWDLFDLLVSTYPNQSIFIANFNGFENAVMLSSIFKPIDNYFKWEQSIESNFPHDTIIFHRGHDYIYARIDSLEIGRYSVAGNFGQIH